MLRSLLILILLLFSHFVNAQSSEKALPDSSGMHSQALAMIEQPAPSFNKSLETPAVDSTQIADMGFEQVYSSTPHTFTMRDGKRLHAQQFEGSSSTTILVLHGVASSGYLYNRMAGLLQEHTQAEVFALDWRGHGRSEGSPGDVDYVDQYAEDLGDVVRSLREENPQQTILLAGHSMGGGISLRYAMQTDAPEVDGYVMFAPLLGNNAPTLQQEMPEASADTEPFMKIHLPRIIGIYIMNSIGVHDYDALPVLFLNMPEGSPLTQYTFRSNASMAPADYKAGLQAINKPLLVVVGSEDEAFVAAAYAPAVEANSEGEVLVVDGATHNGIRHSKQAMEAIQSFVQNIELK
ncbi:MAG: alpha/beta hydrolase [Rhodothermales bacterium]